LKILAHGKSHKNTNVFSPQKQWWGVCPTRFSETGGFSAESN